MIATVHRQANFNSAHRMHNKNWSDEKNKTYYGACNNPNYHGHNYKLIVKITGEIDPESGYVIDMKKVGDLINEEVIERFDHMNLNIDCSEFDNMTTSSENIAMVIHQKLRAKIDPKFKLSIVLYETEKNFVEFSEQ